jgi:hypothetical protein
VNNAFGNQLEVGPLPHGGRLGFVMALQDNGPLAVTIEKVEPLLFPAVSGGTRLFFGPGPGELTQPARLVPTGGVKIPAHQARTFGFDINIRQCKPSQSSGNTISTTAVTITYRIAGVRRTATVPLAQFAVALTGANPCP